MRHLARWSGWLFLGCVAVTTALVTACSDPGREGSAAVVDGGDRRSGRQVIIEQGCASCHTIPGIPNARAYVGPPLEAWSRRSFIAGTLPNSEANLRRFLADPQQVRPGSAMPDLELRPSEIADIVAYLFSLD